LSIKILLIYDNTKDHNSAHQTSEGKKNMSVKNFKFVSPGVFINEIDNSYLPKTVEAIGPVIVGRSARGLAMQPIKVESYSQFVDMFGDTVAGGSNNDVYRDGNYVSPMYGTYAAKAFLRSGVGPVTYIRLLGQQTSAGSTAGLDASAGWKTTKDLDRDSSTAGGAYGLFVCTSGSDTDCSSDGKELHLAATFYMNSGSLSLVGPVRGAGAGGDTALGMTASLGTYNGRGLVLGMDSDNLFTIEYSGSNTSSPKRVKFNFNDNSDKFIRKRFNTNPQLLTTAGAFYPAATVDDVWIGETFEQELRDRDLDTAALQGVILGIGLSGSAATGPQNMKKQASREAVAGWFIGQDLSGDPTSYIPQLQQKLFKLVGRGHGEWLHKNVKVSIEDIRQSNTNATEYGSFSVVLRSLSDTDNNVQIMERFDNCTLDPTSPSYVARKIGDQYTSWDSVSRRLKTYGDYPNNSRFVYVEVNPEVDSAATDPLYLPFGFFGPPKFTDVAAASNAAGYDVGSHKSFVINAQGLSPSCTLLSGAFALAEGFKAAPTPTQANAAGATNQSPFQIMVAGDVRAIPAISEDATFATHLGVRAVTASLIFPVNRSRLSASDGGLANTKNAYWGFSTTRVSSSTKNDNSVAAPNRLLYAGFPDDPTAGTNGAIAAFHANAGIDSWSYVFSLDDLVSGDNGFYYQSGSRANQGLATAGIAAGSATSASWTPILDNEHNRFTAPFWGGFDGWDIQKPDPLYNEGMGSSVTEDTSYAYHTWRRAFDTAADPEYVDMNLMVAPGLTNTSLTEHMINMCEDRGDAMALVDLPSVYIPPHEKYYSDKSSRRGTTPQTAVNDLKDRRIDSSYGATFYPWVQTRDAATGRMLWIPPSVAMIGVLGSSEAKTAVWFAPAGFNRGGLTEGAAGLPITSVTERLTSRDRDLLYEAKINPIASFPNTGIVVFGQKTLQDGASALDRINVRRLSIYLKKQISIISAQILFEQNVQATWDRFKGLVEPFLANVKTKFGITDYKLILDESTTTPDLIDQNILYAKIMVKPARAIEYIAIDFVITSTGASFDD
jgi:hypothetical protein